MAEDEWKLPFDFDGLAQINRLTGLLGGNVAGGLEVRGSGAIRSYNYVAGSAGWSIDGDGNVEFNDGVFRGDLDAVGGTFTGTISGGAIEGGTIDIGGSDSTSFHVDSTGNMWTGSGDYSTGKFKVSAAGAVEATDISITGGEINIDSEFLVDEFGNVTCGSLYIPTGKSGIRVGANDDTGDRVYLFNNFVAWYPQTSNSVTSPTQSYSYIEADRLDLAGAGEEHYVRWNLPYDTSTSYIQGSVERISSSPDVFRNYIRIYAQGTDSFIRLRGDNSFLQLGPGDTCRLPDGDASLPGIAFENDPNTGIYRVSDDVMGFTAVGAQTGYISSNGHMRMKGGSVSFPTFSFVDDTDTGMFNNATNEVSLVAGGTNVARFDYNAGTPQCFIEAVRAQTISTGVQVDINTTTGKMGQTTSSRRFKHDISYGLDDRIVRRSLDHIVPCHFKANEDGSEHIGFIAEDFADVDDRLVMRDENGDVQVYDQKAAVAILWSEVQRLRELVDAR